ncbi:MAG: DUF2298 domain-containing protein [Thermomicrobiales bacterium]
MHLMLMNALLQTSNPLTFDGPVGDLPVVSDARWSAAFTGNSWGAFVMWVAMLVVLQAVAWPLVRVLFARFPDRGWGVSRLLTMMVASWMVWFLASIPVISFRAIWAWTAVIVLGAVSFVLGRWLTQARPEASDWRFWRNRTILAAELVFWAIFALFLIYRLNNPDSYHPIWGGEKPMEFAHINAILRSAHFPPVDPWYAGGYINYYYYGEYLVAFLIKLTGIPIEYAFNLAQPTVIALLASAGFTVAAAFGKHIFRRSVRGTIFAGLVGTFLLSIAGNLVDAARMVDRALHGATPVYAFGYWVWDPSRSIPNVITEFPAFTALYADLHAHVVALPITVAILAVLYTLVLDWRAVAVATSIPAIVPRVVVSLGARLLLLAILIGTLWPTNAWDVPMYVAMSGIAMLMATRGIPVLWRRLGVAVGALAVVGALAYLSILPFMQHYVALFSSVKTNDANTSLVAVESHFGIFFLLIFAGLMTTLAQTGKLSYPLSTPVVPYALVGIVLLYRWWAVGRSAMAIESADALTVIVVIGLLVAAFMMAAPQRCDFGLAAFVPRLAVLAGAAGALLLVTIDRPVPALYLGFGVVAAGLWLSLTDTTTRFLTAMIAGGMLLGTVLEYVYLQDNLWQTTAFRMNTVFKFYNQLWVLFTLASAGLIARMAAGWLARPVTIEEIEVEEVSTTDEGLEVVDVKTVTVRRSGPTSEWPLAGLALAGVLAVASLAFAFQATPARLDQHWDQPGRTLTLDAYDWMTYGEMPFTAQDGATTMVSYKDDLAAINWLNENVHGSPVIAEAAFGAYRCNGSRFSIATGLPAVIGWTGHESQQRSNSDLYPSSDSSGNPIPSREQAMRTFYTDGDVEAKRAFLKEYGVGYVIVGQTETFYPQVNGNDCVITDTSAGMAAIQSMVGTDLEIVFQQGTTTVYKVVSTGAATGGN